MTTDRDLLELAERCEKATGPDRELDALIFIVAEWPTWKLQTACEPFPEQVQPGRIQGPDSIGWRQAPAYTASLDAAMKLVPEGKVWTVRFDPRLSGASVMGADGFDQTHTLAATPALVLCAVALRALAQDRAK